MLRASTNAKTVDGIRRSRGNPAWLRVGPFVLLTLTLACGGSGPTKVVGEVGEDDTTTPPTLPPDTSHGDSTPGDTLPPPDSTPPPPDSTPPPPDPAEPSPPPGPVSHVGLAFGLAHMPPERFSEFSATVYTATDPDTLIRDLETARRANARLYISFTGNQANSGTAAAASTWRNGSRGWIAFADSTSRPT